MYFTQSNQKINLYVTICQITDIKINYTLDILTEVSNPPILFDRSYFMLYCACARSTAHAHNVFCFGYSSFSGISLPISPLIQAQNYG